MSFATSSGIPKSNNPEDGLWLNKASYGVNPRVECCVVFFWYWTRFNTLPKQNSRVGLNLGLMVAMSLLMKSIFCSRNQPWVIFEASAGAESCWYVQGWFWKSYSPPFATSSSKTSSLYVWEFISLPGGQKSGLSVSSPTLPPKPSDLGCPDLENQVYGRLTITCLFHYEQLLIREENLVFRRLALRGLRTLCVRLKRPSGVLPAL